MCLKNRRLPLNLLKLLLLLKGTNTTLMFTTHIGDNVLFAARLLFGLMSF